MKQKFLYDIDGVLAKKTTESIAIALNEDIVIDIVSKGLSTQNGTPGRIWDFINSNLLSAFANTDVIARCSRRGPWEMVLLYDDVSGILFCCMKEKSFRELQSKKKEVRARHYLTALTNTLNADLPIMEQQLSLFEDIRQSYIEEAKIKKTLARFESDLGIPTNIINHHVLVLFRGEIGTLYSVRCCAINSELEIVDWDSWNKYIIVGDNITVDRIVEEDLPNMNPSLGLSLSKKAREKIGERIPNVLEFSELNDKNNNNDK